MKTTLAFDAYGTRFDPDGVRQHARKIAGGRVEEFIRLWRFKQLEHSFLRGLMKRYAAFSISMLYTFRRN